MPSPLSYICRHGQVTYMHFHRSLPALLHLQEERKKQWRGVKCSPPPQLHVGLLLLKYD